jgi:hypothetical protein
MKIMAIPKQVSEAAEMAAKLHGEMFPREAPPEEPASETPAAGAEPADTDPTETPEVPETPAVEEVNWQERYEKLENEHTKLSSQHSSLKGKYNAEVPRLQSEIKQFKQEVLESVNREVAKHDPPEPEKPKENAKLAQFREDYGEDYISNLRELITEEFTPLIEKSINPVQETLNSVRQSQAASAEDQFASSLDSSIEGNWRDAWEGKDEGFIAFLDQPDPSGLYTNGQLFRLFYENLNDEKMATLFNLYYQSSAPPADLPAAPTAVVKPPVEDKNKQALIAPSRATQQSVPTSGPEPIIWTKATQQQFERDDRAGKYSQEESLKLWNDLMLAPGQGRYK